MRIDRRRLLAGFGLGASAIAGRAGAHDGHAMGSFKHGVASGDPLQDRMIFWTRLTPHEGHGLEDIVGELRIGTDAKLARPMKTVKVAASADRDWTVKVDVTGLKPGVEYFYQFHFGKTASPVGRGKTLPDGKTQEAVLAVASCALFIQGYFNAYQAIADLDRVDAVLHLGDYIYEYGVDGYGGDSPMAKERRPEPSHEIVTLADYRLRHACYKADPQLQAAHARAAWIVVWDDHETANDAWMGGAENHTPATEGDWATRKAAALKAYFEWMPIREGKTPEAINRSFRFGDLATVMMTETRLTARNLPLDLEKELIGPDGKPDFRGFYAKLKDPSRALMGPAQEAWLGEELKRSVGAGETWQVIGNQIVMGRVMNPNIKGKMGEEAFNAMLAKLPDFVAKPVAMSSQLSFTDIPVNLDQWDGYPAARERVYDLFKAAKARPIVLAGDSHSFWANELHNNAGEYLAAEFGTTGVTSPGFADLIPGAPLGEALMERNKEVKFADSASKGFVKLTLTRDKAVAEMVAVSTIQSRDFQEKTVATFTVKPEGTGVSRLS